MEKSESNSKRVGEVAARLIGHPACPRRHCGGKLKVEVVTVADRKRMRIGGARVYKCERCGSQVVMTRAEGSAPYVREAEVKVRGKRRADKRQIEMFGDGDGAGK